MATSGAIPFIESFKFVEDSSPQLSVVPNHLLESSKYACVHFYDHHDYSIFMDSYQVLCCLAVAFGH